MELPPSRPVRRLPWAWRLAGVVVTGFLLFFYRPFDWREVARHLGAARWGWLALAVAANLLILLFWAAQWRQFLPAAVRVSWSRMGEVTVLAVAGMNTLPFMGGHALGVGLLAGRGGVGLEVAVAVMALDQVCEGLCKVFLLLLALGVAPRPDWMGHAIGVIGATLVPVLAALVWLSRRPVAEAGGLARWAGHFEALRHPRRWLGGLACNAATKLAEAGGIWAVQHACGVDVPLASVALVLAAVSVATMISVSPGNLGVYEAAAVAAYLVFGVPLAQAVAVALVQHACLLAAMVGPGYLLTVWRSLGRAPAT